MDRDPSDPSGSASDPDGDGTGSTDEQATEPLPPVIIKPPPPSSNRPPGPRRTTGGGTRGSGGTSRRRRRVDRRMTLPGQVGSGEQIPSKVVSNYLFGSETFRGEWRKHPIFLWKQIGAAAVSPFIVGYLGGVLSNADPIVLRVILLLWVLLLLWVMWGVADWYYDRFVLTNKRIMEVSGIVTRKVAMMPLGRVTDMAYNQTVLGRMLNYGTFIVESAGQDQALREISTLPRPNALYLLMCDEMYGSPEAAPPKRTRTRKRESSATPGPWRAD